MKLHKVTQFISRTLVEGVLLYIFIYLSLFFWTALQ